MELKDISDVFISLAKVTAFEKILATIVIL